VSGGSIVGIDHVQVAAPAGCEAQARTFYGDALGLPELAKPDALAARGGCWFACGDRQLHVGVAEPFAPATKAHPALLVRDASAFAAVVARLEAKGFPTRREVALPGLQRAFVDDPFGNRVELVTQPR
jgi:catechol 2,3-dioxygenase-like lactoylglutathione lyase family enzyme